MNQILLVFVGGGLGSLVRFGISRATMPWSATFPFGTLISNILACLIVGLFTGWAGSNATGTASQRLLIVTGFCGGFSTFSTFSAETVQLISDNRLTEAFINISVSLAACISAVMLGIWLGRQILA